MSEHRQYRRLGKFELHELVGEGAMGVVWKAYDPVLRRYVALKLLSSAVGRTKAMRERFLREARAAAALQHPNIITIYDLGESDDQLFIAMELAEGRDLSDLIAACEPLALERKLDMAIEMLEGLQYAHERGVIHRDIKPSNVRITPDGSVKIMDFGIARLQSAESTDPGAIVGTPTYMAPEQITHGPITAATDVFAVGCVLYELLAYRKPFAGETVHGVLYQVLTTDPKPLRTVALSIPAALERVVVKAMNKVPEDRYGNAKDLQQALLGIRAALSGATDGTTERLAARWTPLPAPLLKLVMHTPMKWRVAVLSALVVVVLSLALLPGNPGEPAAALEPGPSLAPAPGIPASVTLHPTVAALRDSAIDARQDAERAGAMQNGVREALLGETLLQNADQAVQGGNVAAASQGWREAVGYYRTALREAARLRQETQRLIDRVEPVVRALGTRPEAAQAAAQLQRADSLLRSSDFALARLAAQSAEQVGVELGIAPPSPQPVDTRVAIEVLLADLGRAVASERVENLRALFATRIPRENELGWQQFFVRARGIRAGYEIISFAADRTSAQADVRALYRFLERDGGPPLEERPRLSVRFTRTAEGWRIADLREVR